MSIERRTPRRRLYWMAGLAALLLIALASWAPAAGAQYSGTFCEGWRGPNGTCSLPVERATNIQVAQIITQERGGCIRFIGYYGEPVSSWECTTPNYFKNIYHEYSTGFYRAEIQNNSGSAGGYFKASFLTW